MATLFALLFLISFICLIIGLIRPQTVIRWGTIKTRKNVLKYFGIPLIAFFILIGITAPKVQPKVQTQSKPEIKVEELAETKLGEIKIHYIDVGQGDSELIQIGDENILIDAGTSDKKSLEYLKSIGISKLDYVISTHPHEDHIGSMDDVINSFEIGVFFAPKATTTTKTFENMINALKKKNLQITVPKVGEKIAKDGATIEFLAPNSDKYEDLNNFSIVCKLKFGNTSFLFDGNAEDISENEILTKQLDVQADVLKVGHHGSHSSTTQGFLDKVNPKYAIISCEKNNDYGHPHKETLDKLNAKNINVFRTDLQGTIMATSNGTDITFNVKPVDKVLNIAGNKNETTVTNSNSNASSDSSTNNNISNSNNNAKTTSKIANSGGTTTNEPAKGERTVYWTSGGKSYHYDKNCKTLARSKNISEGPASSCPKKDPCDVCVK